MTDSRWVGFNRPVEVEFFDVKVTFRCICGEPNTLDLCLGQSTEKKCGFCRRWYRLTNNVDVQLLLEGGEKI